MPRITDFNNLNPKLGSGGGGASPALSGELYTSLSANTLDCVGFGFGGTAPYTYSWDFGDSSPTSSLQFPTHTYAATGPYTVTLTITDANTDTVVLTDNITVSSLGTPDPLTGTILTQVDDLNVQFDVFVDGGTPPYTYAWDLDGSTSTAQNPTAAYTSAGVKNITLTVTDADTTNLPLAKTLTLTLDPLSADFVFVIDDRDGTFISRVEGDASPYTYAWDFAGLGSSVAQDPVFTFPAGDAIYPITLDVTSSVTGATQQVVKNLTVVGPELVGFIGEIIVDRTTWYAPDPIPGKRGAESGTVGEVDPTTITYTAESISPVSGGS